MQPEIGPIKTFGVMFALAFIAAGAVVAKRLQERDEPVDWAYELIFAGLVGGLVGSRVWYLLGHTKQFSHDPFGSIFSGSGLVWYGGAIGGAIGVLGWAWRRNFLNVDLLDICAVPLSLGYAIGRIGCQVSGDGDYGKPSHLPWAMAYPHGTVPTTVKVHPTPIYETLAMGLLAYVLWTYRDRVRPLVLFSLYLVAAGVERFLIEFIRRNDPDVLGLTEAQITSIVMALAGVILLVWIKRRDGSLVNLESANAPTR